MKRRSISVCLVMVLVILAFGIPCASQSVGLFGIERLRQDAQGQVEITLNPLLGTTSFIRGRIPVAAKGLRGGMSAAGKAMAFIDGYADVFGVVRASRELKVIEERVDSTGMRHVTLGQVHNGIEVYNALMKVHLSADGRHVMAVSSGFVPDIRLTDRKARLSADEALARAQRALPNGMLTSSPRLVVYPGVGSELGTLAKLAWLVELRDDTAPARNIYVVDALDGTICDVLSRLFAENPDTLASSGQSGLFYDTMALRKKSVARFSAIGYHTRPATADIGYAVIVEGKSEKWWTEWRADWYFRYCAETAYHALRGLGFDGDRIFYLSSSERDLDGDGEDDTDGSSSKSNVEAAIRQWAGTRVGPESPFILVMVGHGNEEVFATDPPFTSYDLGRWLDALPDGTPMLIVIESCHSGSFITPASGDISAPDRVIVAATHDDAGTWPLVGAHFSLDFRLHLLQHEDVRQAFIEATKDANRKITPLYPLSVFSCQPWLDDNADAVGTSPEDLEQNPPESAGDEGWLASRTTLGLAGVLPSVGEGAPNPEVFQACYTRNGGAAVLGLPVDTAHRWGNGYIQHFRGGQGYEGAIMQPDGSGTAYAVYGSIWSQYIGLGGAAGPLGYPVTDETEGPVSSVTGARCRYNEFGGGAIVHRRASGPHEAKTVFVGQGVFSKWNELGLGESFLGLPVSDEADLTSGARGFGTTGVACEFEAGYIYWHRNGALGGHALEVHGAIAGTYMTEGGGSGWLGFPVTDEYVDADGHPTSGFERGSIVTRDGVRYDAIPHRIGLEAGHGAKPDGTHDPGSPSCCTQPPDPPSCNQNDPVYEYGPCRCGDGEQPLWEDDNTSAVADGVVAFLERRDYAVDVYRTEAEGIRNYRGAAFVAVHNDMCSAPPGGFKVCSGTWKSVTGTDPDADDVSGQLARAITERYARATDMGMDRSEGRYTDIMCYHRTSRWVKTCTPWAIIEMGRWLQDRDMLLNQRGVLAAGIAEGLLEFLGYSDDDDTRQMAACQTLAGVISPPSDIDTYYFDGIEGQEVTLTMVRAPDGVSLDPYLRLFAPSDVGVEVSADNDSGDNGNAIIREFSLPQSGRYLIEALSHEGSSGGKYSLSLQMQAQGRPCRQTYDANHTYDTRARLVRTEGDAPVGDADVDNAHDFAGATYDYYWNTHGRDSYDSQGAGIVSVVHYGRAYMNAFWDGEQVVYGDGFPVKDIAAHKLTHAVTEHSADLGRRWQSGALLESFSDLFAAMVDRDDWTIGEDLPPNILAGRGAIRDLSDPSRFGQPDHTRDWVQTCSDNEGVHTNSGITSKGFYNVAVALGRDKAERILYRALTVYLQSTSSLEDARAAALQSAEDLYGSDGPEYTAVCDAFDTVGLDGEWNPPANDCGCAATVALSDETVFPDPLSARHVASALYQLRDQVLGTTTVGQRYRTLYNQYTGRISYLMLRDPKLRSASAELLRKVAPGLLALAGGSGDEIVITPEMIGDVVSLAEQIAAADRADGGGSLADIMGREADRIDLKELVGMTFEEAWGHINMRVDRSYPLTLPVILKAS